MSPHSDQLPTIHTEGTQNVNSDTVNATIWDTLTRKDVGQSSEQGHKPQVYDMSHSLVEHELFHVPPSSNLWVKREREKGVFSWSEGVANWSQRLSVATPGLK